MPRPTAVAALALALVLASGAPAGARHRRHVAAAAAGPLRPGSYVCEGAGAGMFPVAILPGFGYRAAGPAGRYVAAGGALRFTGGSLANNIGTLDGPAAFALATIGSAKPYTHCTFAPAGSHRRATSSAGHSRR